jgi:hypothetical protein
MGARLRKCFVINGAAYKVTECRHCFKNIAFVPTTRGKRRPVNSDGTVHFATCPVYVARRERKRARVAQGRLFE